MYIYICIRIHIYICIYIYKYNELVPSEKRILLRPQQGDAELILDVSVYIYISI